MDDLLPIGRFARLAGLSVGALRHYDELDLLRPADIDGSTGYRRYRTSQLEDARTIARLRELEVPLEEIREVLAADDPAERARRLDAHRARIEARTYRLQRVLHHVTGVVERKEPIVTKPPGPPDLDQATRRALAAGLFNHTWTLLETNPRTPAQDDEMIHAAHASRYHWGEISDDVHLARGEWQCARVYSVLGRGRAGPLARPALRRAGRGRRRSRGLGPSRGLRGDGPRVARRRRRRRPRPSGRRRRSWPSPRSPIRRTGRASRGTSRPCREARATVDYGASPSSPAGGPVP